MFSERKTENIVREQLRELGYYGQSDIVVEEQKSDIPRVQKLLKNASKRGLSTGYPEFIITSTKYPDILVVIECKADIRKHASDALDRYDEYAVDGSLLYASFLSKEYDVIAIGVSGMTREELKVTHYLLLKGQDKYAAFLSHELLSLEDYYTSYIQSPTKFNEDYKSLLGYSQKLNDTLHNKKIKEAQRGLLISGILIALKNRAFRVGYKGHNTAQQLASNLVNTIANELSLYNIPDGRLENLKSAFSFIKTHATLSVDKRFVEDLVSEIDDRLTPFLRTHKNFDALGQFYIEFLKDANNEKGFGIVLTPPHITELFSELAGVNRDSIVADNCCGTGGFLISAMKIMIKDAEGNSNKIDTIRNTQIVGIEFQDDIYALGVSNMVIHGDGKSNIFQGNCFKISNEVKSMFRPNIGLLNPPYKTQKRDVDELSFVLNNLEMLEQNGTCVAIVPMSCAVASRGKELEYKERLLNNHTLEAVMSMPEALFHNSKAGMVTCTMVFTANVPHPKQKKTWFGYWRNDGFIKVKNLGRIDRDDNWDSIKNCWVTAFNNREIQTGFSVMKEVSAKDEWCAEAYLSTDYSDLAEVSFILTSLDYLSFLTFCCDFERLSSFLLSLTEENIKLVTTEWQEYKISELFKVYRGENRKVEDNNLKEGTPVISATTANNGFSHFCNDRPLSKGNCITIGNTGQRSVGVAFYQPYEFNSTNNINILYPKFPLSEYIGLFIVTVLKRERYKFSYGRILNRERTNNLTIKLPSTETGEPDWEYIENYMKGLPLKKFKRVETKAPTG